MRGRLVNFRKSHVASAVTDESATIGLVHTANLAFQHSKQTVGAALWRSEALLAGTRLYSRSFALTPDMAAAAGGVNAPSNFEELCVAGLPLPTQRREPKEDSQFEPKRRPRPHADGLHGKPARRRRAQPKEDEAWLAGMAADATHPFVPIDHLMLALQKLTDMEEELHSQPTGPQAYLLTGPSGVGKTYLQKAYAKQVAVRNARVGGDRFTLCCSINLAAREPYDTESFCEWLLGSITRKLSKLKEYESVTKVLRLLASSAHGEPRETVDVEHLLSMASAEGDAASAASAELSRRVCAALTGAGTTGHLGLASAVLREANIAVIVLIDKADCLFQGDHFTRECADMWCWQLRRLLSLKYPAVGVVLCTAFQRASQLFVYDGDHHYFPPYFTHHELRKDWNKALLRYIRVGGPAWTRTSLMAFLLTHMCRKVDRSFSLFQRHLDQQPSEEALQVARDLDALCLGGWKGDAGASPEQKLDAFLVHIMEEYGNTPEDLAYSVLELLRACWPPWAWPLPVLGRLEAETYPFRSTPGLAMGTFLGTLSSHQQGRLAKDNMLTFHSGQHTLPRELLEQFLAVHIACHTPYLALVRDASILHQAPALIAVECVDDAMDAGQLTLHDSGLGLRSLRVYRFYMSDP